MSFEPRKGKPYIWVTWITGLIAGDKNCRWAAWFKAHYQYEKRVDPNENKLLEWKAEHAQMVRNIADEAGEKGFRDVAIEDQNDFKYKGKLAIVSGKPDITMRPGQDFGLDFGDAKTGVPRESDAVQVGIYMLLAPIAWDDLTPRDRITGHVFYKHGIRLLDRAFVDGIKDRIVATVTETAMDIAPPKVPSAGECAFCDILDCDQRIHGRPEQTAELSESEPMF